MSGVVFNMAIKSLSICPRANGIYKITNQKTGRFYIGKAESKLGFYGRWSDHRLALRRGVHRNTYLQHSYNKHGEDFFTFEILEIKGYGEDLRDLEFEYIVNLEAMSFQKGYNIKNDKSAKKPPARYRENHPLSKEFEIFDPEGNLVKGKNISQFCEELGFGGTGGISDVINGKIRSYKGFRSANPEFYSPPPEKREYRLLSPDKKLVTFDNISEFERKIGAHSNAIFEVLNGRNSHFKGYHLENPSPKHKELINRFLNKRLLINKSIGVIVSFVKIKAFARKYEVPHKPLFSFFEGRLGSQLTQKHDWSAPTEEEMGLYPIIEEDF